MSTSAPTSLKINAEYHVNNYVSPVLFNDAMKQVPENALVVEVAPTCLLQAILRRALPASVKKIGLLNKLKDDLIEDLLINIGR